MSVLDKKINRRNFIIKATIGTGVMIGAGVVACSPIRRFVAEQIDSGALPYNVKDEAITWFEVTSENIIRLHSPKVEMGQGIFTGLAQLAAEELGVEIHQIEVVHAATNNGPIDPFSTGGSTTISSLWEPLRELAAKMREMLINNAAEILGVEKGSLVSENGIISGGGKSISYGEIVAQSTQWKEPKKVKLKTKDQFKIIGKPITRVDLIPKVMGEPLFGFDASMPNMLYGSVVRCPYVDAKMESFDISKAEQMPGVVKIVLEDDFIG